MGSIHLNVVELEGDGWAAHSVTICGGIYPR